MSSVLTALATKGKRLYDRALKDLSANGWLGADDLELIQAKVRAEFNQDPTLSRNEQNDIVDDDIESVPCDSPGSVDDRPQLERPESDEYQTLLRRAKVILDDIKYVPIERQLRRRLKKKRFSCPEKSRIIDSIF